MKLNFTILLIILFLIFFIDLFPAPNSELTVIISSDRDELLAGANVFLRETNIGASTNLKGEALLHNIPEGNYYLVVSYVGFETYQKELFFPEFNGDTIRVVLETEDTDLEKIIVSSTRSSRSIEDEPTRISVIAAEELDENATMNSANIGELLRETTGVQVQQLSQSTSNATIRIHGLDGKYTQILKDGFPLYSGFAGSMSVLQIPPLDLRQIEVIKGSNSTLYGGGAVGGIINLISKRPAENFLLDLMFNQTSALGTTVNSFLSDRNGNFGYTLYLSGDYQNEQDTDDDNFSNIPYVNSYSINPAFFYTISKSASVFLRLNYTHDFRKGGDMLSFENADEYYFEKNKTDRLSSQAKFEYSLSSSSKISVKNSFSFFRRKMDIPDYKFGGEQFNHFSELIYSFESDPLSWVFGADLKNENFDDYYSTAADQHSYSYATAGLFLQNTFNITENSMVEGGIRSDYNDRFGWFILPRIALLHKFSKNVLSRLSSGFGYNLPTIFNEESEEIHFRNIQPVGTDLEPEKSFSVDWDVNYNLVLDNGLFFSLSQLFFYNIVNNSLILEEEPGGGSYYFVNATGRTTGKGFETNFKGGYYDFTLYLNYIYNDVEVENNGEVFDKPLTPLHTVGSSIIYEEEDNWTIGFEVYYAGPQTLSSGFKTSDYWMTGFMVMKEIDNISLFINFENFTDTKQSDYNRLVNPPRTNPTFNEIWAPIDGFVFNGGIKITFSD